VKMFKGLKARYNRDCWYQIQLTAAFTDHAFKLSV
jgi:hypothetical protein